MLLSPILRIRTFSELLLSNFLLSTLRIYWRKLDKKWLFFPLIDLWWNYWSQKVSFDVSSLSKEIYCNSFDAKQAENLKIFPIIAVAWKVIHNIFNIQQGSLIYGKQWNLWSYSSFLVNLNVCVCVFVCHYYYYYYIVEAMTVAVVWNF